MNQIWGFIAEDSLAEADRFIERIDAKLRVLADNPNLGGDRSELRLGLRSVSLGSYILFYTVRSDGIQLIRVLHGARDRGKIFPVR